MGILILPPDPEGTSSPPSPASSASDTDSSMPDIDIRPTKRAKLTVVPGETITSEPQWMRGHGTTSTSLDNPSISATLAGTILKTNKLLSIIPLRARYTPEIGDLVVGRIVEVQKNRWKVDVSAPLLAQLPLSSINLPGGVLRRRTTADELQMRQYFQEGDLLVAEVQQIGSQDGAATLHTRSLRYGKLRNGVFLAVSGSSGAGVVRSRRQVWTVRTSGGGGEVDVALGVNGYVWLSKHVEAVEDGVPQEGRRMRISISNLDEAVSGVIYSSQNDEIGTATMREIARLAQCVKVLAQESFRVDEDAVMKAYETSLDADLEMQDGMEQDEEVTGDAALRKKIVAAMLAR